MFKKISVIMPVLNEEKTISKCLDALLSLDYPKDKVEIIIAYGNSDDSTNDILEDYANKHKNIKIYPNKTGNTSIGRNICLRMSTGKYIMNYSGHAIAEPNLLKVLSSKLETAPDDVVSVGCSNISPKKNQSTIGELSGFIFESIIGGKGFFVQNESYDKEQYVDHISFALYKKDKIEEFDEFFWCGQDAELDLRLTKKGYKILYTPETRVYHHKRENIKSLFRQMYKYGFARAKMGKKHKNAVKLQHFIGTFFILLVAIIFLMSIFINPVILLLSMILYSIGVMSVLVEKEIEPLEMLLTPFVAFSIHSGYGLGFLRGIL